MVIVVLSRPTAAARERPPPGGFLVASVAPLTPAHQEELAALLLPPDQLARLRAEVLSQPRLQVLAGNPLLLTLVAIVAATAWKEGTSTSRHRLDLYELAVRLFLERGWATNGQGMRDPEHALYLLEELALHLQEQEGEAWTRPELSAALDTLRQADEQVNYRVRETWKTNHELLEELGQHAGLLGPRDGPRAPWRFLHRSFREYLAARALARRPARERLARVDGVEEDGDDNFATRWGEVLGMLCGLVETAEGEAHLERLVEQVPTVALRALPAMEHLPVARRVEVLDALGSVGWGEDTLVAMQEGLRSATSQQALDALVGETARPAMERLIALSLLEAERQRARLELEGPAAATLLDVTGPLGWLGAALVPRLVGVAPEERFRLLLSFKRGVDHLDDTLDVMGDEVAELWNQIGPTTGEEQLGLFWYALERHGTGGVGWPHPDHAALLTRLLRAAGHDRQPPRLSWVDIPAGCFEMGSREGEGSDWERPRHPVQLGTFQMSQSPVTDSVLAAFRGETAQSKLPAVHLDWFTARLVAAWLGGRLPTEAEWEYACRAGTQTQYWSGDAEEDLARVGWYRKNSDGKRHPVGQKPANPWGLVDMHGNVWEWCEDRLGPYSEAAADPSPRGPNRVVRGGSCWVDPSWCRSATRPGNPPGFQYVNIGFRVVRSAPSLRRDKP